MQKKHEDQVCNGAVDFIVKRKNLTMNEICCPDREKKDNMPSVDRLIKCRGAEIVLEHTLIESCPEQISDSKRVDRLLGPLRAELTSQLPMPGHYELSIDMGAVKGAKDARFIRSALIKWIKEKAPSIQVGSPNVASAHYIREKPPGVPFEVTLYRFPRRDGEFLISVNAPQDLKNQRRQRVRKALEDKCPKLCDARGDERISILLLELDDIFLGNYSETGQAIGEELCPRNDLPDEIYLVETEKKPWAIWIVKDGTCLFQDIENPGPYYLDPIEKAKYNVGG